MKLLIKGAEAALPTASGSASDFDKATGTDYVVKVQETANGTDVGTFTILRGSVEILEKQPTHTVSVNTGTDVLGAKVGYTN